MRKTGKKLIVIAALFGILTMSVPTPNASAGPLLCAATATGGAVVAFFSLFTGPGIFVTAPTILSATGLACVVPTP